MKCPTTIPSRPVVRLKDHLFSHRSFLYLKQLQAIAPMTLIDIIDADVPNVSLISLDLRNYMDVVRCNNGA